MSKAKNNNGTILTYRFNQRLFSEIEMVEQEILTRCITKVPDPESIREIRKLTFRASRIKKSKLLSDPKLSILDFKELLNLMQQKVNALERGKSISRAKAIANQTSIK